MAQRTCDGVKPYRAVFNDSFGSDDQLFDVGGHAFGLVGGRITGDWLPVLVDQKFGEIPFDRLKPHQPGLFLFQIFEQRVCVVTVDFDFGEDGKCHVISQRAKTGDLFRAAGFLRTELVARKAENGEPPVLIFTVQRLEPCILRREPTFRRDIHDENRAADFTQFQFRAVGLLDRVIIDAHRACSCAVHGSMDHIKVLVTTSKPSSRSHRLIARILIASIAVLAVLIFDMRPAVPVKKAPTAAQANRARVLADRVRIQLMQGNGETTVRLDVTDLASLAALASGIAKFGRSDAAFGPDAVVIRNSRSIGPVWLNLSLRVGRSAKGLPDLNLNIGDLPLGKALSRWLINRIFGMLQARRGVIMGLDEIIRSVTIERTSIAVAIDVPPESNIVNALSSIRTRPVDAAHTAAIYCRLFVQNRIRPTSDMAMIVRRAFAPTSSTLAIVEQNRATFTALAMYTTTPDAGRLSGRALRHVSQCQTDRIEPLLAGRADLAKHWAVSAALAVTLGDDVGGAIGEWKELSDSRPGGSGFSFVDLAADRGGLAAARLASDPETASLAANRLRQVTAEDLLPIRALALSEGISERRFLERYASIDSREFSAAKARVDRVIGRTFGR